MGGVATATAAATAFSSPTPVPRPSAVFVAVAISAPFTWSGFQFGCSARICAAAPATCGAANDVPDIHM